MTTKRRGFGTTGWLLPAVLLCAAMAGVRVSAQSAAATATEESPAAEPDDQAARVSDTDVTPSQLILSEPLSLPRGAAVRSVVIDAVDAGGERLVTWNSTVQIEGLLRRRLEMNSQQPYEPFAASGTFEQGRLVLTSSVADGRHFTIGPAGLRISAGDQELISGLRPRVYSEWWRIVPPLIAILLAVVIRDVNVSLILATFTGCLLYFNFTDIPAAVNLLCETLQNQLADADHASVILFTVFLGAMIGLMNDSGGTQAVVNGMARYANTRERGQLLTWFMGLVVFFDDYANALLIGGAMRPLSDRLRISREKLAFLIDSTAAPIAGVAIVSTWVAFETDQIAAGLSAMGLSISEAKIAAPSVFYRTIPYRIYPLLALTMVAAVAKTGKDFGPMLRAEERALRGSEPALEVSADPQARGSVWYAILPVFTLVGLVLISWLADIDSYRALLIASFVSSVLAFVLPVAGRKMSFANCSASWTTGVGSMIPAVIVLILAWAVSDVCRPDQLDTAGLIISHVGNSVSIEVLPAIAFLVAGAIALSIGSSFTTMALLTPLFIPLCWALLTAESAIPFSSTNPIFLATVGAILAGAIFGDHCSPISDTTVLSSAAAGCDHLQHVNTQFPYALLAGLLSVVTGYLPMGFGVPWWIALPTGMGVTIGAIVVLGKRPDVVSLPVSDTE